MILATLYFLSSFSTCCILEEEKTALFWDKKVVKTKVLQAEIS